MSARIGLVGARALLGGLLRGGSLLGRGCLSGGGLSFGCCLFECCRLGACSLGASGDGLELSTDAAHLAFGDLLVLPKQRVRNLSAIGRDVRLYTTMVTVHTLTLEAFPNLAVEHGVLF